MKGEIIIAVVSISIILGLAFFIFNIQQSNFTNFVVYNDSSENSAVTNENLNEDIAATKENALQAINDSEEIMQEMKEHNLSVVYMGDLLTEAKKVFEQDNYAGVLDYTEQIKERREKAFEIYDILTVIEMSLEKYEKKGIDMNESRNLLEKAKTAFYEDRYQEAEDLLEQTRSNIDSTVSEVSILKDLEKNTINFVQRNWYYILLVLFILAIVTYFSYKQIESNLLKNKIRRMKAERIALNGLMKKAQTERYKENKISGLTYNIKIKKYQEKLAEIDEELPISEEKLKKFKTNKNRLNKEKGGKF